jgi:hypothetical protein
MQVARYSKTPKDVEIQKVIPMKRQILLTMTLALAGCQTAQVNTQLTDINKDWDRMIRASHIYPIYPLTQDIVPGDVYFYSQSIEDTSAWDQSGYLPLDHLIARLTPTNYAAFYGKSWKLTNDLPNLWLTNNSWSNAPVSGFPSFSFSVQQGGGASVALPIQGIPVGLSLMEAKQASGIVTLTDTYTYGIDELSLRRQVWEFVTNQGNGLQYLIQEGDTNIYYLQIVTRVFTVGEVSVSMANDSAVGASLWGGSPKNVPTPTMQAQGTNTAANYSNAAVNMSNMVSAVNSTVPAATNVSNILPGGTLKFNMVSSRSVSMNETFPKPVVIGYDGFSFAIRRKGKVIQVGESLSHDELVQTLQNQKGYHGHVTFYDADANTSLIENWLKNNKTHRDELRQWLDAQGHKNDGITNVTYGSEFKDLREQIVEQFNIK